ncbi:hypothetical protein PFISCL1PPCAC_4043, partial [Pristionchus fissidentatus]
NVKDLIALGFADYFGMVHIMEQSLEYLLSHRLPEKLIKDALVLADRIPNNARMLRWVLNHILEEKQFFQLLHTCLPSISVETAQVCLKDLQIVVQEERGVHERRNYAILQSSLTQDSVGLQVQCKDYRDRNSVKTEIHFVINTKQNLLDINEVWKRIPVGYNLIHIKGMMYARSTLNTLPIPVTSEELIHVEAHIARIV